MDRDILCIKRTEAFSYGFAPVDNLPWVAQQIRENAVSMDRQEAETDALHKQVIPYIMVVASSPNGDHLLGGVRLGGGNEDRLHQKIALGFGGHVKWQDGLDPWEMIEDTVKDELLEELGYTLRPGDDIELVGILDADVTDVDSVHTGLVYTLRVRLDDPFWQNVKSNEPHKLRVFWSTPFYISALTDRMEEWAKLVYMAVISGSHQLEGPEEA